jgi:hypothetical protein
MYKFPVNLSPAHRDGAFCFPFGRRPVGAFLRPPLCVF